MRSDGVLARIYEVNRVEFNFLLVTSNETEGEEITAIKNIRLVEAEIEMHELNSEFLLVNLLGSEI